MKPQRQILQEQTSFALHNLYDRYAGMLLGYLLEIVKDRDKAEEHLVSIFETIPQHIDRITGDGVNTWCELQRLARTYLAGTMYADTTSEAKFPNTANKFSALMNDEQHAVFCSIYYYGKTTAQLAQELGKTEDLIRKALREAFAIIRKAS
ncbi:RNA polymerase sigma factor [Mucilaginibacter agri]|uniref:Sigma-70 family RNA polymerase sigma factor n=1 Tax=Mucilaginibacter agri TaxID=2695265 RepID=A0A965ZDH3_9SPHI|nr:sigma-70 family RNA polymerase sigma factor [Mucilaginibacter agri]NCD68745.1 hypothetical protein [Mucilaginibacter agri]